MPSFSQKSLDQLDTTDLVLQKLFNKVIEVHDCTIIQGHRPKQIQDMYFKTGRSKVQWPDSKHNESPSLALDVAPYIQGRGIPWPQKPSSWEHASSRNRYIKDLNQFYYFAGIVKGVAEEMKINIRWGGDWDMDNDLRDNRFDDLVHFELLR